MPTKALTLTGRILTILLTLFLLVDAGGKIARIEPVMQACRDLGIPDSLVLPIGVTLLLCTALYAIPNTALLGCILLTGYLGGAIFTHVRMTDQPFQAAFAASFATLLWLALYLREPRLRTLIPLRRTA